MDLPVDRATHIMEDILRKGGDFKYVLDVISLIWQEEAAKIYSEKHPEEVYSPPFLRDLRFEIKKYDKDNLAYVKTNVLPDFLIQEGSAGIFIPVVFAELNLEKLLKKFKLVVQDKEFMPSKLNGRLTITYEQEFSHNDKRYILTCSDTISLSDFNIKKRRGPRGSPQSNVAIFLFDRYFQRIGLKRKHETIAAFCNDFSKLFFCKGTGFQLSSENVRKRIQWVKKRKSLVEYAEKFEKEKLITPNR